MVKHLWSNKKCQISIPDLDIDDMLFMYSFNCLVLPFGQGLPQDFFLTVSSVMLGHPSHWVEFLQ